MSTTDLPITITLSAAELAVLDRAVADYHGWQAENAAGPGYGFLPHQATRESVLCYWLAERLADAALGQGRRPPRQKERQ